MGIWGHIDGILKLGGKVLAIDQDQEAIDFAKERLAKNCPKGTFKIVRANFASLKKIIEENQLEVQGVLFDLGVSTYQLTGNGRGFSFQVEESLDMRMDPENQTVTAADLVNGLYENELEKLITEYGQDRLAKSIARAIVLERKIQAIRTTTELREIIENIYRRKYSSKSFRNPATKTFQALRIAVNDELNNFKKALKVSLKILSPKGRIAVISFHELEDRIVKHQFLAWQENELGQIIAKKPIVPELKEIINNPNSRSSKLRIFEKN